MAETGLNRLNSLKACGDLIPHAVCILDWKGRMLYANQEMESTASWSSSDLVKAFSSGALDDLTTLARASISNNQQVEGILCLEFGHREPGGYIVKFQPEVCEPIEDSFCVLGFSLTSIPETAGSQTELNWATAHVLLPKQLRSTILGEALPHLVWCCNVDVDCEFANKVFCDYTGWVEDDFMGKKWVELIHPDDLTPTFTAWADAINQPADDSSGPKMYSIEHRMRAADGSFRWFKSRATPIFDEDGAIKMWFGTSTDIDSVVCAKAELETVVRALDAEVAARRRADQKLETQYAVSAVLAISKSLMEAAPKMLQIICQNLGWESGGIWASISNAAPQNLLYLASSDDVNAIHAIPECKMETANLLVTSIRSTNRPAWISHATDGDKEKAEPYGLPSIESGSALALPVMSDDDCSACMIFFSDETREPDKEILQMLMTLAGNVGQFMDLWHAEEVTREQGLEAMRAETRLRAILSSMREGLCQLDSQGHCIYLNPAAEKMLGYELNSIRDLNMHDLIYARHQNGRDCIESECPILSVMQTGTPCHIEEDSFLTKDETLLTVQFSSAPLLVNELLAGAVIVFRDIGELIKLRQQRDSFFAILTHDLKTPLLAADRVLGPLLKGASGPFNSEQFHVLELLKKSNSELLQMVQIVLALYRYSDSKTLQNELVEVKTVAKYAIAQTSGLAESRNITVNETWHSKPTPAVFADSTAIQHLIANLLENAIKFTPFGGTVELSGRQVDSEVEIEVRDSGLGLTPFEMENLFLPFQRNGKRGMKNSSGLGLYLCKQIVESYRGQIQCTNTEGFGATFTVTLPAARSKSKTAAQVT